AYKLDVAGDINFTGSLLQNGSPFSAGGSLWTDNLGDINYSGGNVGIGTSEPVVNLHVASSAGNDTAVLIDAGDGEIAGNPSLMYGIGGLPVWVSGVDGESGTYSVSSLGGDVAFAANVIGNVGIGTLTPNSTLHVSGSGSDTVLTLASDISANAKISWGDNSSIYWTSGFNASDGSFSIDNVGLSSTPLYLDISSGNVGIGTTTPSSALDIAGDINFTGTLYQNGSPFSAGGGSLWTDAGSVIYYDGNVGIGTASPASSLDVVGDINFTGTLLQNGSPFSAGGGSVWTDNLGDISYSGGAVSIGVADTTFGLTLGNSTNFGMLHGSVAPFSIYQQGTAWVIDGEQTDADNTTLVIRTGAEDHIRMGVGAFSGAGIEDIAFGTIEGVPAMVLDSGKLGIGTSTPSAALEVAGDAIVLGNVSTSTGFIGDGAGLTNIGSSSLAPNALDGMDGSGLTNLPFQRNVTTVTALVTLDGTHQVVIADLSGGDFTITLPDPTTCQGRCYTIKNTNGVESFLTIATLGGANVEYSPTYDLLDDQAATFISDGTNWWNISTSGAGGAVQ
ncbi:MAG: hypothetical protein NUW37_08245, partial [Planctomycetes bacterium]|nr:hypothetical protein [Planctomycetota bacterium]